MVFRFDRHVKSVLLLGFAGVAIATVAAHSNPVTGYELSIYTGTPVAFWVCTFFALMVSILAVFSGVNRHIRMLGVLLGGLTMTTLVSLPIIRGYHYVGETDSLSHLGVARDMNAGLLALTENRYPIVHPLGSVLHDATGLAIHHALLVVVVVFVGCFIVFVPLVVRELTGGGWTTYVGFFSGLLLLPINHLSPSLYIHPTSQAILYIPVVLFIFFVIYRQRMARHSMIFLLLAPMFVLLHPQQAANLVLFFGVIALLQIGYDLNRGRWLEGWTDWVLPEVTFFAIVFWLWARHLDRFWSSLERVYMIPFEETRAAETTAMRSVSLAQVGGSLPEIFVKLFLISFVYVLLTGILMVLIFRNYSIFTPNSKHETIASDGGDTRRLPMYVFGGLFAVTLIFSVYLIGGISDQYFRHLGTLMVFGTILGAVMIGRAMGYFRRLWSNTIARQSIALVLILCIALTFPVIFNSPYLYYTSNHVSKVQMDGYETTFEYQADSIVFGDIRSNVYRYGHAIQGLELSEDAYYQAGGEDIPDHFADQSLRRYYDEPIYVPVTEADRIRDPILWNGFRFSNDDFAYLETEPGINKVQTNGGYDLYLVEPAEASSVDSSSAQG